MNEWKKLLIKPEESIRKTIEVIDIGSMQIALVVNSDGKLVGTATDGDIRRGILRGISLEDEVSKVMCQTPTVATETQTQNSIFSLMKRKDLHQIPVVDSNWKVIGLKTFSDYIEAPLTRENWVTIMAGGLGSRLGEITKDCPKPLLKVGSKPLLETILESFIEFGFRKFYLAVNYQAEKIQDYFGNGSKWEVEIQYILENKPMGTAGALSLLPKIPDESILVMNGDILTKVNFQNLLDYHKKHQADATMCIREYDIQLPYGIIETEQHKIISIHEKPIQTYFINAGIYVLSPEVLQLIPSQEFFNMTDLFGQLVKTNKSSAVYPIREYWIDIGRMEDYQKANGEFSDVFPSIRTDVDE